MRPFRLDLKRTILTFCGILDKELLYIKDEEFDCKILMCLDEILTERQQRYFYELYPCDVDSYYEACENLSSFYPDMKNKPDAVRISVKRILLKFKETLENIENPEKQDELIGLRELVGWLRQKNIKKKKGCTN
ncbi:MAG: hypothetical protein K9L30_15880 [Desulfobacterales bacterium]|nr:hypothetical protein [Desulfobacterales bacterium]